MTDDLPPDFFPPLERPPPEQRRGHRASIWMQPRPAEPLDLVVVWEDVGIATNAIRIDGAAIVAAAEEAGPMWDDGAGR